MRELSAEWLTEGMIALVYLTIPSGFASLNHLPFLRGGFTQSYSLYDKNAEKSTLLCVFKSLSCLTLRCDSFSLFLMDVQLIVRYLQTGLIKFFPDYSECGTA